VAEDRERCFASGMDDYLVKPFRREQVEALLVEWGGGEDRVDERAA